MPRRWFQIHLSTALVMMVVASVLLGISVWRRQTPVEYYQSTKYFYDYGWPIWSRLETFDDLMGVGGSDGMPQGAWIYESISYTYIINPCINLSIVGLVGLVWEFFTRRKDRKL